MDGRRFTVSCISRPAYRRPRPVAPTTAGPGPADTGSGLSCALLLQFISAFALAYRALPVADLPPMATNPVRLRALRAFLTASAQALMPLLAKAFLARAEAALLTILPFLFLIRLALVIPLAVFSLVPRKTIALASLPLAILLTLLAFIAFMAFMAFMPFIAAAFFMGSAIAVEKWLE